MISKHRVYLEYMSTTAGTESNIYTCSATIRLVNAPLKMTLMSGEKLLPYTGLYPPQLRTMRSTDASLGT